MTELRPELGKDILAACQSGAGEIAESFSRTFSATLQVTPGEVAAVDQDALPPEFDGPGLLIGFRQGQGGAVAALAESCGLIPAWYAEPDATGQSKLTTLAQELGLLLFPESAQPEEFQAARVESLKQALSRSQPTAQASALTMTLTDLEEHRGTVYLIWPVALPLVDFVGASTLAKKPAAEKIAVSPPKPASSVGARPLNFPSSVLPSYSRSLLRISVPVTVTLAAKKQAVGRIVELGPGSIIQFDKSCEELLELEVGGHKVGEGEAVKVGDKFGLRLASLTLPEDRFVPVGKPPANKR